MVDNRDKQSFKKRREKKIHEAFYSRMSYSIHVLSR